MTDRNLKTLFPEESSAAPGEAAQDFKDSIVPLFDHFIKRSDITKEQTDTIARLRAKVMIEVRNI